MMSDKSKEDFYNFFNQFDRENLKLISVIGCDADGRVVVLSIGGMPKQSLIEILKQAQESILFNNTTTLLHGTIPEL